MFYELVVNKGKDGTTAGKKTIEEEDDPKWSSGMNRSVDISAASHVAFGYNTRRRPLLAVEARSVGQTPGAWVFSLLV